MGEEKIELPPAFVEPVLGASYDVVSRLEHSEISWAFFSGVAAAAYGVERPINDIDIIFSDHCNEAAARVFHDFNVSKKPESELALSQNNIELVSGRLRYHSNGEVYQFTFDRDMISRRNTIRWRGCDYYFLSREDTIILKAILRREAQGTEFDVADVIIISKNGDLDWDYLAFRAEKCGAVDRIAPVLEIINSNHR